MKERKDTFGLSLRGLKLAQNPSRIDIELFLEAAANQFHPVDNPTGSFLLNVAENKMIDHLILTRMKQILSSNKIPDWVLNYTAPLGHPDVRETLADFMRDYLKCRSIQADNLALSSGASASLELTSFILANPGEIVAIPAPSYPMYTHDLGVKSKMERFDLHTHYEIKDQTSLALVDIPLLEKTKADLLKNGKHFRMLLITNPDNPTGSLYTSDQLIKMAKWCNNHAIHMVVNEVYALSEIDNPENQMEEKHKENVRFSSFARIMEQMESEYLHLIYALSKDFAMSGMRIGIIHSLNQKFIKALENANIQHMVSNLSQWVIQQMFLDKSYIKSLVHENRQMINKSYKLTAQVLQSLDIPFIPAKGGLFVWMDLSAFIADNTTAVEMEFWMKLYRDTSILLTPGKGFQHLKKGLFRLVYTAVPYEYLVIALNKLSDYLKRLRKGG